MGERFPETSWTLLAKARRQDSEGARAREEFAQRYYRPVREFLLILVHDPEEAEELSQELFIKLSGPGGLLERADREKGSFRNYLQQSLRHLVIDYRRRKRSEALQMHPDQVSAGGWEILELAAFPVAEAVFHHAWVKLTLAEALSRVRALCIKRKQQVHLELFEARYLSEAHLTPPWDELGGRYGMDQKTARDHASRVASHFRLILRRMLRNEIAGPVRSGRVTDAEIDAEIQALLAPLRD